MRSSGWRVLLTVLARLPQPALSRVAGRLADLRIPTRLRAPLFGAFARASGIDLSEAERPLAEYRTFDEFFIRRLRPGARPVPHDPTILACPVDGLVGQTGALSGLDALQAKGRTYSIARLIDDEADARCFDGGSFVTLYLSPRHYHHVHSPCDGIISHARHVPGALLPVNPAASNYVADLFPRNERLVCWIDGPLGRIAVVAIGAFNVGRISAAFDPTWNDMGRRAVTNRGTVQPETRRYVPPRAVRQGDDIMTFHLGSTVVLLIQRGCVLEPRLEQGSDVCVGQPLARPSRVD